MAKARHILLVDDSDDVRGLVAEYLRRDGYSVTEAVDLGAARELLLRSTFDAVVTDVGLPDGDGVSLIPFVGVGRPTTRVVVITGNATLNEAVRALHAGAYDFIPKPVQRDALLSAVSRAVEAKCLENENEQLLSRLAGRIHALKDMLDISREVAGSLELERVLSGALDRMVTFFRAEAGSILLRNSDGSLRFAIVCGPSAGELTGMSLPPHTGVAGWVSDRRRPVIVNRTDRDPRFSRKADEATGVVTRNVLACPLLHKGQLVGVLEILNAGRGKFTRDDKIAAETLSFSIAAAIENARANEKLGMSQQMLLEVNRTLEERVAERTAELEQTRDQMVRAEKMASIGTIAAGVAHEINNPIGFINSNLQTLKGYISDLKPIVEELRKQVTPDAALTSRMEKVGLDFVLGDIETLVRESEDGVKRVVKIVKDLKTFSHSGGGAAEDTDLNSCIEAALNLSRNEVKYVADVKTELGQVPKFTAFPTEITQVLVNLVVNAGHAITGAGAPRGVTPAGQGTITVRSRVEDGWAVVEVGDTGCGIPKEIRSRIFDPFFTTKEPGKGTGLGLSLSWEIVVERHHGELSVESEVGEGTTFTMRLPLAPASSATRAVA
jgi:signal transduction histidine kinase/CheY-like chemotaxis protein